MALLLLRSVCGGVRRFVVCFLGCLFSDPSVSKNVPERKIRLRFPMQNPLEIVGCSERYQNQYQIDPGERFVTFSNTKSSRNRFALRTIETIQKSMQNRLGRARRAISLRFLMQNRFEIVVCPETIQKPIQKTTWASDSFTFSITKSSRTRCVLQNDAETNAKSTRVSDPLRFPIQTRLEIVVG